MAVSSTLFYTLPVHARRAIWNIPHPFSNRSEYIRETHTPISAASLSQFPKSFITTRQYL